MAVESTPIKSESSDFGFVPKSKPQATLSVYSRNKMNEITQCALDAKEVRQQNKVNVLTKKFDSPENKQMDAAQARRAEKLAQLQKIREKDNEKVKETVIRHKQMREQRFERLLGNLYTEDALKQEITDVLRAKIYARNNQIRKQYKDWHTNVFEHIQKQVTKITNPPLRMTMRALGEDQVHWKKPLVEEDKLTPNAGHFKTTVDKAVAYVDESKDPLKQSTYQTKSEKEFQRLAKFVCTGESDPNELPLDHALSKPMLEPFYWSNLQLQATPYGHFSQVAEVYADGGDPRTLRRVKGFMHDESDGVDASGKRKMRMKGGKINLEGVLKEGFAQNGEAYQYKDAHGSGHAAPCQDHYAFDKTKIATDIEFPIAKRMWAVAPGAVPRKIIDDAQAKHRAKKAAERVADGIETA